YTMGAIGGSINQYAQANNDGNKWNGAAANLVVKSSPGTNIFFDNIKVVGPDGKPRDIAPMVFTLK
ncbi:MAG: GldM family protein, partial [Chitinophagales bacterium]